MIRFFSAFWLIFFCFPFATFAEENPFLPAFCAEIQEKNPYFLDFQSNLESGKKFLESFESVKKSYHDHMNSVFNEQMESLNQSYLIKKKTETEACTPTQNEWEDDTSMKKIMAEELKVLEQYKCALLAYQFDPVVQTSGLLETGVADLQDAENMMTAEIANAEYAFLMTLQMYGEMRMYYPVHRDLECLIQELTEYRDSLEKFVDIIVTLPRKFLNFGTHNPR